MLDGLLGIGGNIKVTAPTLYNPDRTPVGKQGCLVVVRAEAIAGQGWDRK